MASHANDHFPSAAPIMRSGAKVEDHWSVSAVTWNLMSYLLSVAFDEGFRKDTNRAHCEEVEQPYGTSSQRQHSINRLPVNCVVTIGLLYTRSHFNY